MLKRIFLFLLLMNLIVFSEVDVPRDLQAENWYSNAEWLLENNRFDKALTAVNRAIEIFPEKQEYLDLKDQIIRSQSEFFEIDYKYDIEKLVLKTVSASRKYQTFGQKVYTVNTSEKKKVYLGLRYIEQGDREKGVDLIKKAIAENENFGFAYHTLGKIHFLSDPELAFSYFKRAYYIRKDEETTLFLLASAAFLKRFDYSEMLIRTIGDKYDNTDLGAYIALFSNILELDRQIYKEFERQKVDKVEYLDMPAKLSVIFYNKKYIVEKIFDILHDYYSDNWFYYYLRGYLNAYFLDTDGAAVYYEKALHNAQAYNRDEIAEVYEEYRDRKKVVLDPNSYEALFMKASNFYRNGLYKKSMELARKALLKAEDKAPVYKVMGLCYYGLGEFEESKRHLAKASEKMPDDKDILFTFGEIYFLERNYYEALDYYKNVLKIDPEHIESLFRIGKIYSEQSEHEDALTYMRQVLDHEPNHVEALVVMGNIYTKTNRFEEAISAFQRALEIDPGLIDAYVSLSIVYYKKWEIENNSRMLDSAIEVLQQASELDPENDMVNQYLQYYIQQKAGG